MIEMHDIEKYHQSGPRKTYVLRYVHLNVAEGEFVSIMGPSGAGKSTLLHIMGMLDEPTAGSYRFLGEEVGGMGEKERTEIHRQHIGFVFQA
ncbi:MAG: ATP-binding cassette domain-containing protein, partial [Gemmatimonadota bacterium]|nr:ATP-binding cassette domain-containing protein [Gemmatimonadota bacterium]